MVQTSRRWWLPHWQHSSWCNTIGVTPNYIAAHYMPIAPTLCLYGAIQYSCIITQHSAVIVKVHCITSAKYIYICTLPSAKYIYNSQCEWHIRGLLNEESSCLGGKITIATLEAIMRAHRFATLFQDICNWRQSA